MPLFHRDSTPVQCSGRFLTLSVSLKGYFDAACLRVRVQVCVENLKLVSVTCCLALALDGITQYLANDIVVSEERFGLLLNCLA